MSQAGAFSGSFLTSMDKKGRVSVPAQLRNAIPGEANAKSIYVTAPFGCPYLLISDVGKLERYRAQLAMLVENALQRGDTNEYSEFRDMGFGSGETYPMDASGRFVLSDTLAIIAQFPEGEGDLFCYGVGDGFQLWDVERLLATDEPKYAAAKRMAAASIAARDRKARRA